MYIIYTTHVGISHNQAYTITSANQMLTPFTSACYIVLLQGCQPIKFLWQQVAEFLKPKKLLQSCGNQFICLATATGLSACKAVSEKTAQGVFIGATFSAQTLIGLYSS